MRFRGKVGYGDSSEDPLAPGKWEDVITEVDYQGDILRDAKLNKQGDQIISDLRVNNSISVVADERARKHYYKIKYVLWEDVAWVVSNVELRPPRLILTLGGEYNGPRATT